MFLFLKENLFELIFILILLVVLAYVVNISSIPDSIILFQDDDFIYETIAGIQIEEEESNQNEQTISVGAELTSDQSKESNASDSVESDTLVVPKSKTYNLSLLGVKVKTITASVIPNRKVIPLGNLAGLKLYTEGVLVVGLDQIEGEDGKLYKPYEELGIEQGDSIIKINNEEVETTEELLECVSKSKGKTISITYLKDGKTVESSITPVKTGDNTYKLGLWVRDAAAGVGTLSFYDPSTNSIASLGHGIQDVDTGEMVDISSGEFVTSEIVDIQKGEEDKPGRIEGSIEDSHTMGGIYSNTRFGVYGYMTNQDILQMDESQAMEIALRNEIEEGDATIICTLEDGVKEEYSVKIQKIFRNNNDDNKSMIIKVTDERLLEKTGGIIQGMSGSPIIQNGKFIGAVTHVLVNNPQEGYAVFGDIMLKQSKET